ncbi:MAG TPA: hypothetical protein VEL11_10535 [Candidatus Bathyarchaeia archaeon]|nr:hypothetical protein [Candidatus Bathyarchaeia archaeon]
MHYLDKQSRPSKVTCLKVQICRYGIIIPIIGRKHVNLTIYASLIRRYAISINFIIIEHDKGWGIVAL